MSCAVRPSALYTIWNPSSVGANKSNSYHDSSLYHCDIYIGFFFPPLHTNTIPPTHSIRAIISAVTGSNKAVTQGRRLAMVSLLNPTTLDKKHRGRDIAIITSQLRVHLSGSPAEVLPWKTVGFVSSREEEECLHTSLWIAAQRWEGCIYPWASSADI